jgi:hypothetical protein
MPAFQMGKLHGRAFKPRSMSGGQSFLLGNSLGGLQSVGEEESAYSGRGLEQINQKLEKLMIKTKKSKPANIKFSM